MNDWLHDVEGARGNIMTNKLTDDMRLLELEEICEVQAARLHELAANVSSGKAKPLEGVIVAPPVEILGRSTSAYWTDGIRRDGFRGRLRYCIVCPARIQERRRSVNGQTQWWLPPLKHKAGCPASRGTG